MTERQNVKVSVRFKHPRIYEHLSRKVQRCCISSIAHQSSKRRPPQRINTTQQVTASNDVHKHHQPPVNTPLSRAAMNQDGLMWTYLIPAISVSLSTKEETQRVEARQLEEVWFITWFLQTSRLTLDCCNHFLTEKQFVTSVSLCRAAVWRNLLLLF